MMLVTKTIRRISKCLPALVVSLSVSSCGGIHNAINPAGPQAGNISRVWWLMLVVCTVVFVLVMIALLLGLKKANRDEQLTAPVLEPPVESERRRRMVVISALVMTVVILFVFVVASFSAGRNMSAELADKDGLTIEITGHQWWWEARYLDVDASNIFTTANEIHIPVGVPVTFSLRSNDVIHSFWVPNLSGKKDLIPGKISTIWLQADKPGVYRGQCGEYCGLQHARMALWVVAEPQEQFDAWRQNQTQTSVMPATESQKFGQQVFLSTTCVMCHKINGTPAASNVGPNLTHVGSRRMIAAASLTNTREHMREWIKNSQVFKPGNRMPPNNLGEDQLQALVDYLQNLK